MRKFNLKAQFYFFLIIFILNGAIMNAAEWTNNEFGSQCLTLLKSAPYPHKNRANGYTYQDKNYSMQEHYNDSTVAFLIPNGYKPSKQTDFILYFHGHMNNVKTAIEQFNLSSELNESGKNLIMIFPEGPKDVPDSDCGKLMDVQGFKNLIDESMDFLKSEKKIPQKSSIGKIILSGHSGAYRVIGKILSFGGYLENIKEVYLLDATYGELESFKNWIYSSRTHRLFSIFTEHLASDNVVLMSMIQKEGNKKYKLVLDEDLTDEILKKNKIIFSHTTQLGHNDVVSKNNHLRRLISTSCIKNK